MTTAHRPTWKAAVGRADEGGWTAGGRSSTAVSALDVAAHTVLKTRRGHQVVVQDRRQAALQQSLIELEQAENKHRLPKRQVDPETEERAQKRLLKQTAEVDEVKLKEKYDDADVDEGGGGAASDDESSNLDGDDSNDLDESGSSSSGDDEEEDDEAALQAELAKIRAEREQAKQKEQQEADAEEAAKQEEAALLGNPLLSGPTSTASGRSTKRRWNEDVVFRNQAKGEPAPTKRFINDTVRNDFHKRFLNKFIR